MLIMLESLEQTIKKKDLHCNNAQAIQFLKSSKLVNPVLNIKEVIYAM
jgi:hypothetical protein